MTETEIQERVEEKEQGGCSQHPAFHLVPFAFLSSFTELKKKLLFICLIFKNAFWMMYLNE